MFSDGIKEIILGQEDFQPIVLALGFFDSIHLGHRCLIEEAEMLAEEKGAVPALFTFNNNPFDAMRKDVKLILTYDERKDVLSRTTGIKTVISAHFDEDFMNLSGKEFLSKLFRYNIKGLVCGYDYTFGKKGKCNVDDLVAFAKKKGVSVSVIPPFCMGGERISSTEIRKSLENGDVEKSERLLGTEWIISSIVEKGDGIGRKLGFPTANLLHEKDKLVPQHGVYGGITEIDGKSYYAIVHIGERPTVKGNLLRIEAHVVGFSGNLYGRRITVKIKKRIRDVMKFDTVEALSRQIALDKQSFEEYMTVKNV